MNLQYCNISKIPSSTNWKLSKFFTSRQVILKGNIVLFNFECVRLQNYSCNYVFVLISLIKDTFYIFQPKFHQEFIEGKAQIVHNPPNQKYIKTKCVSIILFQLKITAKPPTHQQYQNLNGPKNSQNYQDLQIWISQHISLRELSEMEKLWANQRNRCISLALVIMYRNAMLWKLVKLCIKAQCFKKPNKIYYSNCCVLYLGGFLMMPSRQYYCVASLLFCTARRPNVTVSLLNAQYLNGCQRHFYY